ncbi:hypothetical protein ABZ883_13345 [Streptomyces sp. NPDC046977]|uniref:hypothetical protein n=1 Tax=Streptomyces sp. NPDC046977 TaxID=3154703 RepID=UPI0033EDD630
MLVEDHGGLLVLRLPTDETLDPADIADLSRSLGGQDNAACIIVGAEGEAAHELWPRLSEVLDSLREAGMRTVRLVMAGAGTDRPGRPALARRIAEKWRLVVEAPDGQALVVPGGSVFVPSRKEGWWRFAPGEAPTALGPRLPRPRWQSSLRESSESAVRGCTVEHIPAGLLIRPADSNRISADDLFHGVPVDPKRPALVVGVPFGEDVSAADVVGLLRTLPGLAESGLRLIPGGRSDLLPLAQTVAQALRADVEVTTGLPLIASDGPMGQPTLRSVLFTNDAAPSWLPFVPAVLCSPALDGQVGGPPQPRVLRWFTPIPGAGGSPATGPGSTHGVVHLSDEWQLVVTRAGMWVCSRFGPPVSHTWRPVSPEGPVVEVGRPGDRLSPTLWPVLSRLLTALTTDLRSRTTLHVHAAVPDGGRALRALAAEHGLRVIRFSQPKPAGQRSPTSTDNRPGERSGTPSTRPQGSAAPYHEQPPAVGGMSAAPPPMLGSQPSVPNHAEAPTSPAPLALPKPRSTELARNSFRALAADIWEQHAGGVRRFLSRIPDLDEREYEPAHVDLVAVRMYLSEAGGPLDHAALTASLRAGDARLIPYAACLTSGLGRLPAYRGAVLRGSGDADVSGALQPGVLLRDPAPVSAVPAFGGTPGPAYAIWSITGRRVRSLFDDYDEIVFAPGTAFRVLKIRQEGGFPLVLLRQLPHGTAAPSAGALEDADMTALTQLEQALAGRTAHAPSALPMRCIGPIVQH